MKERRVIKPGPFAGARMLEHGRSNRLSSQPIAVAPLATQLILNAIIFDRLFVGGLENKRPAQAELNAVIAHVLDLLLDEPLAQFRREALIDLARVDNRRFTTDARGHETEEKDPGGPMKLVRVFVVGKDRLARGILSGRVDSA